MITEYKLVGDSWTSDLEKRVNVLIAEGWQPFGNIMVNGPIFYQAMVKTGA